MKFSVLTGAVVLSIFGALSVVTQGHAEVVVKEAVLEAGLAQKTALNKSQNRAIATKQLSNVKINMQRMLRSQDGQYFLQLNAGVWNPSATLTLLNVDRKIAFEGLQKGDQLNLSSVLSDAGNILQGDYQLSGVLNSNSGNLNAKLQQKGQLEAAAIAFEPAVQVKDKPTLVFKFYAAGNAKSAQNQIESIAVIDKKNQKVIQTLTGFQALSRVVEYKDINFDGYYDLVLADASQAESLNGQSYIYWMYNPKTGQYQRSAQMEKVQGYPSLDGVKQQIDFGHGQLYQVENGLLKRVM